MSSANGKRKKRKNRRESNVNISKKSSKRVKSSVENDREKLLLSIDDLFKKYVTSNTLQEEESCISLDGMLQLCSDLGVEPEDPVMLILSYYMEAKEMGVFTLREFRKGCIKLKCFNISDLKSKIPYIRSKLREKIHPQIYQFCFTWACEPGQRSLEREKAIPLWEILLQPLDSLYTPKWLEFLKTDKKNTRGFSKDAWFGVLRFFSFVKENSLQDYDADNGAFPSIVDEFVDKLEKEQPESAGDVI
mmetsp:Transcript_2206/g.2537  ORF Transcript_2206/g.2537 Transcript_2206/m.2537 type:complete len:247 (-) Transcript_2206:242-982(-)